MARPMESEAGMLPMTGLQVIGLTGIGEVEPGCDLAALLAGGLDRLGLSPQPNDVLVVTSKIISKAEGRLVSLNGVAVGDEAATLAARTRKDPRLVALVLAESTAVVRAVPGVLITRHRSGHVMANAGIDQSNLGPDAAGAAADDRVLLLPLDADASARCLRQDLALLSPSAPAIVISDSFGRPWRRGVVNVALGAAGLPALVDWRGEADRNGRPMQVTQIALADMIARAAGLIMGEGAEGIPAALVRGLSWDAPCGPAADLVRPAEEDLFR